MGITVHTAGGAEMAAALFPLAFVKGKRGFCMRFSEAIQEYGFDCRARKLSDKSIGNYQKQLRYFQRYPERNTASLKRKKYGASTSNSFSCQWMTKAESHDTSTIC